MTKPLLPFGKHAVLIGGVDLGVVLRRGGLHVRDAVAILGPGPRIDLAYIVRAPLEGTVVESIVRKGTGVLHIDACRVESTKQTAAGTIGGYQGASDGHYAHGTGRRYDSTGRWPPNLLLVHSKGCIRTAVRRRGVHSEAGGHQIVGRVQPPVRGCTDEDGREVEVWECCPGCPVPLLDVLSGERRSTLTGRSDGPKENPATARPDAFYGALKGGLGLVYADSGGASRFYPQFSGYDSALLWLSRMVTP
jgi:hypothetical protein